MDLGRALARLTPSGALPEPLRRAVARLGFAQVLTTRTAIVDLLEHDDVTVPYAARSAPLGLAAFPLALDGDAHRRARALVADALDESAPAHHAGVRRARQVADAVVKGAPRGRVGPAQLDVVAEVVEPALQAWVERWFGLEGWGADLLLTGRLITHTTFFNPAVPEGKVDLGALRRAVDGLAAQRVDLVAAMADASHGSLSHALLRRTDGDHELAASHLQGLTVGPLALGCTSLALALDALLERPRALAGLTSTTSAAAAYRQAIRRRPPLPGVLRTNPVARKVHGGRRAVSVPAGLVLAATSCPVHLGDEGEPDLVFGYGAHACLGVEHITAVASEVLAAVAERRPRRFEGGPGGLADSAPPADVPDPGVRRWPFPGHLVVSLDA